MSRVTIMLMLSLNVVLTTLFYVLVDAPLCLWLMSEGVALEPWWNYIPILVGMISFGIAGSFLLMRQPRHSPAYALAIMAVPFILIWSGLMDIASMTAQHIYCGSPPLGWLEVEWLQEGAGWFWLEPKLTHGLPFLPYLVSTLCNHGIITTTDVIASSIIGALIVLSIHLFLILVCFLG